MPRLNSYRELEHLREQLREQRQNITTAVMVCGGTGCQASQSQAVIDAVRDELSRQGLEHSVRLCVTGCHGFCEQGPVMVIEPGNVFYCHVSPEDAFEIVSQTLTKGEVIERLLYTDPVSGKRFQTESEIPFYQAQDRQILSRNLMVDPCSIEDYIVVGGYSALTRVLNGMAPDEIIKEVKGVIRAEVKDNILLISTDSDLRAEISKVMVQNDLPLIRKGIQAFTLDDIYMKYFHED